MKVVFLFLLAGVVLSSSNLVVLNTDCPEQYISDVNQICIRPDFIEGCVEYLNTKECNLCTKEYQNVDGKCSLIDQNAINPVILIGCLKHSQGRCVNCANGFIKNGGQCVQGVRECAEYKDGSCVLCNEEYSLMFDECRHNLLLGCKYELPDHRCAECFPPFEINSYSCVIKDCKKYNDFGCYSCECGHYITASRSCKKYEDGCLKYYRGVCHECMPHFKLKGGICVIDGCREHKDHTCVACTQNYELSNGICEIKDCLSWSDDKCLICKEGFNMIGGKCVEEKEKFICSG